MKAPAALILFSQSPVKYAYLCEAAIFYAFCIIDFMESENHFLIYFCTDDISDVPIKVPSSFLSHHSYFPFYYTLFSFHSSLYSNLKQRDILTPCGTGGSWRLTKTKDKSSDHIITQRIIIEVYYMYYYSSFYILGYMNIRFHIFITSTTSMVA